MGRMAWGATTPRVCLGSVAIGKRLWRSRAVEKSQSRLSHRAWKSRPKRGIPTSPQPRRRRVINRQPDNSLATKTGPFNLLRTISDQQPATKGKRPTSSLAPPASTANADTLTGKQVPGRFEIDAASREKDSKSQSRH